MSSASKFVIGETVKLKSGGPDMSVRALPNPITNVYVCQWFAGKKLEQGSFPEDSIETVKTEKS